jgi:fermentation-respiration switch protein FrsA (DUF1100 family)
VWALARLSLVALVVVTGVLAAAQRRLIYFPLAGVPAPVRVGLPRAEPVQFPTDDGLTLQGWFVPPAADVPPRQVTILVFNGNGGNRAFRAPLAARLSDRGFATLLFDYRGYGGNPGTPSEEGLALDARAARRYLLARPGGADRLVYYGESLGGAVAVRLAVEHRPTALVLRSPFTSLADVGRHHYPFLPVRSLLLDRYPSLERIGDIRCPVLVVAGMADRIVPPVQSERLYEAAPLPKRLFVVQGADHNDEALLAGPEVLDAVVSFLDGLT